MEGRRPPTFGKPTAGKLSAARITVAGSFSTIGEICTRGRRGRRPSNVDAGIYRIFNVVASNSGGPAASPAAGTNATDPPGLHEERLRRDADTLEGVEVLNNFAYATNNAGEGI